MNSAKLNEWLQVVGLFGVISSLVFVGLQMRQDRDIALSVATQARTETNIQHIMETSSNPILASAIDKVELGQSESLLPSEKRALLLSGTAVLFNFENAHYQYQNGYVAEERWSGSRQTLKGLLRSSYGARATYEGDPASWGESFQRVVDELIIEIDSEVTSAQ